jgi:hypothetical protein
VTKRREVSPVALEVGDEVLIVDRCPSDEGFRHVVDDVRDIGGGWVRVWFDVLVDGVARARWDRLYDVAGSCPVLEVVA